MTPSEYAYERLKQTAMQKSQSPNKDGIVTILNLAPLGVSVIKHHLPSGAQSAKIASWLDMEQSRVDPIEWACREAEKELRGFVGLPVLMEFEPGVPLNEDAAAELFNAQREGRPVPDGIDIFAPTEGERTVIAPLSPEKDYGFQAIDERGRLNCPIREFEWEAEQDAVYAGYARQMDDELVFSPGVEVRKVQRTE